MDKRVLVVATTMEHIENFHLPYIEGLQKAGAEVLTMAGGDVKKGSRPTFHIDFDNKFLSKSNFRLIEKIRYILEKHHFDIVFLNTTLASFFVRLAIKRLEYKPKVVNIVHGYSFGTTARGFKNAMLLNAEKYVKSVTDDIIVMNKEDFDIATKYKLAKASIQKINGMGFNADQRIKDNYFMFPRLPEKCLQLTYVGELCERKNQKDLISLVKRLEIKGVDAKLCLVGKGSMESELKFFARALGVESKVNFVGYDKKIQKYLSRTDFYVSASKIEGLPFNILEAMKAGCVTISANVKGCNDIIEDGGNGFLYNLGDIEGLANKIIEIKDKPAMLTHIKANAKKSIEKYEFANVYDKNLQIFIKFMKESKW